MGATGVAKDIMVTLGAGSVGPSCPFPLDKVKGVKVRLAGSKLPWSLEAGLLETEGGKAKLTRVGDCVLIIVVLKNFI